MMPVSPVHVIPSISQFSISCYHPDALMTLRSLIVRGLITLMTLRFFYHPSSYLRLSITHTFAIILTTLLVDYHLDKVETNNT